MLATSLGQAAQDGVSSGSTVAVAGRAASAAARRQQGCVSGRRAAAPARQRRGDGGAEAAAGRWPQRQNDKVSGRAREAAAQGGVSGGSAVAAFLLRCGVGSTYYYDT